MGKNTFFWAECAKHYKKGIKRTGSGRIIAQRTGDRVLVTDGYTACIVPPYIYTEMRRECPYLEPLEDGQACNVNGPDNVHVTVDDMRGLWQAASKPADYIPAQRLPLMQDAGDKQVRWYRADDGRSIAIDTRFDALLTAAFGAPVIDAASTVKYPSIYCMDEGGCGVMALPVSVKTTPAEIWA